MLIYHWIKKKFYPVKSTALMLVTMIKSSLECFLGQSNRKKVTAAPIEIKVQVFMLTQGAEKFRLLMKQLGSLYSALETMYEKIKDHEFFIWNKTNN